MQRDPAEFQNLKSCYYSYRTFTLLIIPFSLFVTSEKFLLLNDQAKLPITDKSLLRRKKCLVVVIFVVKDKICVESSFISYNNVGMKVLECDKDF